MSVRAAHRTRLVHGAEPTFPMSACFGSVLVARAAFSGFDTKKEQKGAKKSSYESVLISPHTLTRSFARKWKHKITRPPLYSAFLPPSAMLCLKKGNPLKRRKKHSRQNYFLDERSQLPSEQKVSLLIRVSWSRGAIGPSRLFP